MWLLALTLTVVRIGAPQPLYSPGPCSLVNAADAAALVGAGGAAPTSEGPAPDEDTGAQRSVCVYQGAQAMLIVMVLEFPTAEAASATLTQEMVSAQLEDESAKVEQEAGLGDRAYWGTTEHGLAYVVLRGPRVLGVVLGGPGLGDASQHRAALRKMTAAAVGRL